MLGTHEEIDEKSKRNDCGKEEETGNVSPINPYQMETMLQDEEKKETQSLPVSIYHAI